MVVLARLQSLTNKTSLKLIHRHLLRRYRRWRLLFRNLSIKNLTRPIHVTNVSPAHDDYSYGIVFRSTGATILIFQKTSYTTFSPHTIITFSSNEPRIPDLYSCYRKSKDFDDAYGSCNDSDEDDDDYGRRRRGDVVVVPIVVLIQCEIWTQESL